MIVQDDRFDSTYSLTVCPITSSDAGTRFTRPQLLPSSSNGLVLPSWLMIDKLTTIERHNVGKKIGTLDAVNQDRLDASLALFLGLA